MAAPKFQLRDLGRAAIVALGDAMAWAIGNDVHPFVVTGVINDPSATDDMGNASSRGTIIEGIVLRTTREGETYLKRQAFRVEHVFGRIGEAKGLDDKSVEDLEGTLATQRVSYLASLPNAGTVAS